MLLAIIALSVIVAVLLYRDATAQRRQTSAVALERARQDLLLNRLATRTPGEYVAMTSALSEVTQPSAATKPAPVEYLYDDFGLIQSIEEPDRV